MTKTAILIGINYIGQQGQLAGCVNDISDMHDYLAAAGYEAFYVLTDEPAAYRGTANGVIAAPTRANITACCKMVMGQAREGDSLFFHYSGHGSQMRAEDGRRTEEDGMDETICPVDYARAGQIRDGELRRMLVDAAAARRAHLRVVLDCCHSGSGLDLNWNLRPVRAGRRGVSAAAALVAPAASQLAVTSQLAATSQLASAIAAAVNPQVDDLVVAAVRARLAEWVGREAAAKIDVSLETFGVAGTVTATEAGTAAGAEGATVDAGEPLFDFWMEGTATVTAKQRGFLSQFIANYQTAAAGLVAASSAAAAAVPVAVAPMTICISGCLDDQTSADASFANRPNGALTRAVLDCLRGEGRTAPAVNFVQRVSDRLARGGYEQVPQLSASTALNWWQPFM